MNNINEFLNYIQGDKRGIIKVYKNKYMIKINQNEIEQENKLGDIYFIPNIGGDKNEEINMFNAVFIDLDAGRDENKNYLPLNQVQEYKNNKLKEINKFLLQPTFVVETRNGLHVYWVLDDNSNLDIWKLCIDKLIIKFDSDKQACNPARLMRMPFTYWMKDKNNPFETKIIEFNNIKYKTNEILDVLSDIKLEKKKNKKSSDSEFCVGDRISNNKHFFISDTKLNKKLIAIKNSDVEYLQLALQPKEILFENQQEFYNYITQEIDLNEFLGVVGGKFNCIFHEDDSPSAGIFISKLDQYFYKCHSSNCGFMGNIIRCVERLRRCNRPQSIEFIKKVYKLKIKETEWQKEQKEIIMENKRMIQEGEIEEYYPELYKFIKRYELVLYQLHDIAIDILPRTLVTSVVS